MDELKLLIEMVAGLPAMATWVLVGFFAYKVIVIGSVYGLVRYVTGQVFGWLMSPTYKTKEIRPLVDGMCISGHLDDLMIEIRRIRGKGLGVPSEYAHGASVAWLRKAIDAQEALDRQSK
mgnify:FL=1